MDIPDYKLIYREAKKDLAYDRKQDKYIALLFLPFGILSGFMFGPLFGVYIAVFMYLLFYLRRYLTLKKPPLIYNIKLKDKREREWTGGKLTFSQPDRKSYFYYFDLEVIEAYTFNENGKLENRNVAPSISERINQPKVYALLKPGNNALLIYASTGSLLGIYCEGEYQSALRYDP